MLLAALVCLAITVAALIFAMALAPRCGLIAHPRGHCTHDVPTPVVGGIGMAIGLFATWLVADMRNPEMPIALGALGLILIGIHDDRVGLPARRKLLAQAAVVAIALFFDGDLLYSLGELLPGVQVRLAVLALPFTVFAVLGVINAVNMIDGLDGLAGKVMLSSFGWLAASMWMVGGMTRLTSNLAIIGALLAFLMFNARIPGRPRALMFMGDTGSMLLGYLLAVAAIDATQRARGIPPVTALWICALPIVDTLSVAIQRIRDGRSPMAAGRDHLHHLLRAYQVPVGKVALVEGAIAALLGLAGVTGWRLGVPEWIMFASLLALGVAWHLASASAWRRIRARESVIEALVPLAADPAIGGAIPDPPTISMPVREIDAAERTIAGTPAAGRAAGNAAIAPHAEAAHPEAPV